MERDDVKKIAQLRTLAKASQWTENKKSRYFKYLEYLNANDKAQRTQCIYAANIKSLGDFILQKEFEDYNEVDMVGYKTSLKEHGYAPYSIHNHMLDCQTFIKWCLRLENGEKPSCMKWYQVNKHQIIKNLNPQEILSPEDVKRLVSSAGSIRNKALVFVLWESGCRISELLNVKIGDLKFSDKVVSFFVGKSKTKGGEREIFLIQSVPLLMDWLNSHEFRHDKDRPLFYTISRRAMGGNLYTSNVNCILERSAKKCGITKPVNPHSLRKSRATYFAKRRHSGEIMKKMFGWADSSTMPSLYARIASEDVRNALMEDADLKPATEDDNTLQLIKCPFCGTINSPEAEICKNMVCLRPITQEGVMKEREKQREFMLEIMAGEFVKLKTEMMAELRRVYN